MWTNKGSWKLEQLPVWLLAPDVVMVGVQWVVVYSTAACM